MDSSKIIDALGGTAEVARLCRVRMPSVSEWRKTGIPDARRMYLEAIRPDVFDEKQPLPSAELSSAATESVANPGA